MIGFEQIQTFFIVLAAVLAFVALLDNAAERIAKRFSKPVNEINEIKERLDKHDELLDKDNKRYAVIETESRLLLRGVNLIVSHEVNGNDISKLEEYSNEITEYLISR